MTPIHVAAATDDRYAVLAGVMLGSLLDHLDPAAELVVHLAVSGVSPENRRRIEELVVLHRFTLDWIEVQPELCAKFPTWTHLSPAANVRLLLPDLLPGCSRVLYLDCDVMCRRSVAELWDTDLGGHPLAAAIDVGATPGELARAGLNLESYFNSGVLLLDLDAIRRSGYRARLEEALHHPELDHDQIILNWIFRDQVRWLDPRWNAMPELFRDSLRRYPMPMRRAMTAAFRDPAIVHFFGIKPLSCRCKARFRREFWRELRRTPFAGTPMRDVSLYNHLWRISPQWLLKTVSVCKRTVRSMAGGGR